MKTQRNIDLVYWSHSKLLYDTNKEYEIYEYLLSKFLKLVAPNCTIPELESIEKYLEIVSKCDKLVVSEFQGFIGRGCYREMKTAFLENIPVQVLRSFGRGYKLYLVSENKVQIHDPDDWRMRYAIIR